MSYPAIIIGLILQFCTLFCHGQYYFKHYQTRDGLPHNSVRSIVQDHRGFIWIGTRGGLCRFDGYNFKLCKNNNDPYGTIGNNVINSLAEDKDGILWIGTGKGMYRYDTIYETISPVDLIPQLYIEQIIADDDHLWLIANSTLWCYYVKERRVKNYQLQVSALFLDSEKKLWAGNKNGEIHIFNPNGSPLTTMNVIKSGKGNNSISTFLPLDNKRILIGCFGSGLKLYDRVTQQTTAIKLSNDSIKNLFVRDICKDNDGTYWVATESGVFIYDAETAHYQHLCRRADDPYSITDNAVYKICKDKSGGLWLATFFGGLNYYSRENARIRKFYPIAGQNSISGYAVREIVPDHQGNLWIGTEDAGLNKFDLNKQLFKTYSSTGKQAISYPNIHGLLAIDNDLLIGPFHRGLEVLDIKKGLIRQQHKSIGKLGESSNDFVLSIYQTSDGTVLVGTAYDEKAGLFVYDREGKAFDRVKYVSGQPYVLTIREDKQGYIWIGTMADGVYYYHSKTGNHGNIHLGQQTAVGRTNEFPVYGILEDSMGFLWFTTEGGGLIRLSADRKTTKRYDTATGLPTNVYFSMLEDSSQNLWISSLKGLVCIDLKTETFKNYRQANGLTTDQFNFSSAYKDSHGLMYFGSVKGMVAFDPQDLLKTVPSPPIFITGLEIDNKEIHPGEDNAPIQKSIVNLDTIHLAYYQNTFSIEFAALNYAAPEVTLYEYLLEGLDQKPTLLTANRRAYFTDIQPGTYHFTVRAKSNTGSWSSQDRRLAIIITPPFWKTYTAYSVYILIMILLMFLMIRYYHQRTVHKNTEKLRLFKHEKEKEIYEAKIEFFTNVTHEIQTPLTLILGRVQSMLRKITDSAGLKKSLLMVEKNALRLTDLTAQLLDFRKTEMHQFELNFVKTDVNKLLEELVTSFKQIALEKNIEVTYQHPTTAIIAFIDREAMVKIGSNLLSNAIKYGETRVAIRLHVSNSDENRFIVHFENDSKPIPEKFERKIFEPFFRVDAKNGAGTGIGLSLARSLSELNNGTLELAQNGGGTVIFELNLPLRQHREFELSHWKKI